MSKRVRLTKHASTRAEIRSRENPKKLGNKVARRLHGMLKAGVKPDGRLGVKVSLEDNLVAICVPSLMGGWDIVTVIREEEAG